MIKIKDIYAGKPDAKDEIENEGFDQFLSSYIEPINFNVNALLNDSFCFISGYKGTGKTALLYYLDSIAKERDPQTCSSFVFFKGDFADMHRQDMVLTSKRMFSSISIGNDVIKDGNDFEYIWRWLFYQRIWEDNKDFNLGLFNDDENWQKFDKDAVTLQMGGSFGEITGMLCDRCLKVIAIEPSYKKAQAMLKRYENKENLEVIVGTIGNITLNEKFDYVVIYERIKGENRI